MNLHNTVIDHWTHRLPTSAKLIMAMISIGTIAMAPLTFAVYLPISLAIFFSVWASKVPLKFLLKRLTLILPLCLLLAITQVLTRQLTAVETNLVILRAILSMTTMIILIATTPFKEILKTLRSWGLPPIMITLLTFIIQFTVILQDELEKAHTVILLRAGNLSIPFRTFLFSRLLGLLFIRTYDRSQRVYDNMLLRGHDPKLVMNQELPLIDPELAQTSAPR